MFVGNKPVVAQPEGRNLLFAYITAVVGNVDAWQCFEFQQK